MAHCQTTIKDLIKFGKFGTDFMNYEYQRNQNGDTKILGQCAGQRPSRHFRLLKASRETTSGQINPNKESSGHFNGRQRTT